MGIAGLIAAPLGGAYAWMALLVPEAIFGLLAGRDRLVGRQ